MVWLSTLILPVQGHWTSWPLFSASVQGLGFRVSVTLRLRGCPWYPDRGVESGRGYNLQGPDALDALPCLLTLH